MSVKIINNGNSDKKRNISMSTMPQCCILWSVR